LISLLKTVHFLPSRRVVYYRSSTYCKFWYPGLLCPKIFEISVFFKIFWGKVVIGWIISTRFRIPL